MKKFFLQRRVLLGLGTIAIVAVIAVAGTNAFFTDAESSTNNSLTAGAIDLTVDNTSYVTNGAGQLVASPTTTWTATNLTTEKFFNFADLKPGDVGEDTISLHVNSNPAWACMNINLTGTPENGQSEPEIADDSTSGPTQGELQNQLNFAFWADDGDNVYEQGETIFSQGSAASVFNNQNKTLADSTGSVFGTGALNGGSDYFIGKAWCFGSMTPTPVAPGTGNPITRGTGFACNGAGVNNSAQTDGITADVTFTAIQSRNNAQFTCGSPTVVTETDLAPNVAAVIANPTKWFFYNDTSDTIDSSLGTTVAGPATPFYGSNSFQFTLAASPLDRKNIATYQFSNVPLSSISAMSFGSYSHNGSGGAGPTESPFLNFNVDFNGSNTWQSRLVYVPSANGAAPQDSWNNNDAYQGGAALWTWSRYAKGPDDNILTLGDNNTWPDGNTNQYRTWSAILAAFPSIKTRTTDSWLGVRVGEPGPTGYIGNVDFFRVTIGGVTKIFDFGN